MRTSEYVLCIYIHNVCVCMYIHMYIHTYVCTLTEKQNNAHWGCRLKSVAKIYFFFDENDVLKIYMCSIEIFTDYESKKK